MLLLGCAGAGVRARQPKPDLADPEGCKVPQGDANLSWDFLAPLDIHIYIYTYICIYLFVHLFFS